MIVVIIVLSMACAFGLVAAVLPGARRPPPRDGGFIAFTPDELPERHRRRVV